MAVNAYDYFGIGWMVLGALLLLLFLVFLVISMRVEEVVRRELDREITNDVPVVHLIRVLTWITALSSFLAFFIGFANIVFF